MRGTLYSTTLVACLLTLSMASDVSAQSNSGLFDGNTQGNWTWHLLPNGLLFRSYIAGPKEPRFSSAWLHDRERGWHWDSTLGGRVGILRFSQSGSPDRWQWDLEGAAMPRLDLQNAQDLESVDYRVGTQITMLRGRWAHKFGYVHISSHVGDEFLERNPTFQRINFVRESLIAASSYHVTNELRIYGESSWAFIRGDEAQPWQFQMGAEYSFTGADAVLGAPFVATHMEFRQEVDFDPALNTLAGWQWRGPESGRTLRVGVQYFRGPSNQFEFVDRYDDQLGFGVWFDY